MDLEFSIEQQLLDESLASLFARHAGVARARGIGGTVDHDLLALLDAAGYLDVYADAGPIEAILVVERAAAAVASAPVAARVLVGPLAGVRDLPPTVGLVNGPAGLVRFAGHCEAYLALDGDEARLASADDVEVEPVVSVAAYPMGRVQLRRSEPLGVGSGDRLRRAWQVGIAAEIGATARAAVEFSGSTFGTAHSSADPSDRSRRCSTGWPTATAWRGPASGWPGGAPGRWVTSSSPPPPPPSPAAPPN